MPDWNLRIHWNPLCKWKRHFISRLSGGFVCISSSPSADRRSDPSGETTINGVPYFFVIQLIDTFLTKISGLETKPVSFFQPSSQSTLILFALPYCIASFDGVSFSHSLMCDPTRRKTCRTNYFFSKKHFLHFSEHIFCSIHHLTCLHHVQRITATF